MSIFSCTGLANPNIALIKYWGNRDESLRLPSNGSISMNLDSIHTITKVTFDPVFSKDSLLINQKEIKGSALQRVSYFLDIVRHMAGISMFAAVLSQNNFPTGAGLASSASAFAALSLAASGALGLNLSEKDLSRLARRGSGSACRSVPGGFVEWLPGESDEDSYACSFAPPEAWDLVDCIALVQKKKKAVGSTEGHRIAATSPLQQARLADTPRRLSLCKQAITEKDFDKLAFVVEQDSNMMHAVMLTSSTALIYWEPATLKIIRLIPTWRKDGLPVCYTVDAGANVHVITTLSFAETVQHRLKMLPEVMDVITVGVGGKARLLETGVIINPD